MASLLIIRLVPANPVAGDDFTAYLNGLTITAYDSSFAIPFPDSTSPVLGSAKYVSPGWSPGSLVPPDFTGSGIAQHVTGQWISGNFVYDYTAVATAVIVLPDYPAAGEYLRADPYLIIQRSGVNIADPQIYYNVNVMAGQPSNPDPNGFQGYSITSINLSLPAPGDQGGNSSLLPANGNAPNFNQLHTAVTNCMNADPGNTSAIEALTIDECLHIANELLWDEKSDPIPTPPNNDTLDSLYTGPITAGSTQDNDRKQFEGNLQSYYITLNAQAQKLAEYIFSLSAALSSATTSQNATACGFYFPVLPGVAGTEITKVILSGVGTPPAALSPAFSVPAKFFYALTAMLPHQINAQQRFQLTSMDASSQIVDTINQAISDKVIDKVAGDLTPDQVARRLTALGLTQETGTPVYVLNAGSNAQTLVTDWLNYTAPDIDNFWAALPNPAADTAGQLDLLLCVVTQNTTALITAITSAPFSVASAAQLAAKTDADWEALFTANPALLPDFTKPGTTAERIQAFIRQLRTFFTVINASPGPVNPVANHIPGLSRPANPVDTLLTLYPGFTFASWNPAQLTTAVATLFPGNTAMQQQFIDWLTCIQNAINLTNGIAPSALQFSVIEAIWSAGFISAARINALTEADFANALAGTVAWQFAQTIWNNAGAIGPNPTGGATGFQPINDHCELVDCLPPPQLSPLGPVAYLHDLLRLAPESTCANPFPTGVNDTLATLLATRRGPLGDLLATKSNLEIPLPLVDIVDESLEYMAATGNAHGTVYNNTNLHAPEWVFDALPEHATPAVLTAEQGAYDLLKNDDSACCLPYSQPLDVNRTYLRQLGTSRYETMRHFRKNITEFVLDPNHAPAGFQAFLWRYPVDINTAIEYLCISPEEYKNLFQPQDPANNNNGASPSAVSEQGGSLSAFLHYTCLSYCEFVELWKCQFIPIGLRDNAEFQFPVCEPCCLDKYVLSFSNGQDGGQQLTQLLLFIRLWRKLNECSCGSDCRCGNHPHPHHYSFTELADICTVLQLFQGNTINPDFIRQLAAFQMLRDDFHLPLTREGKIAANATGAERTQLLALWSSTASAEAVGWATDQLLHHLPDYAIVHHGCERKRRPEFLKILKANFDALEDLAGFNSQVATDKWNVSPTHTLRFAEVLSKIYASEFSVGEILFLFTTKHHPDGDDAFPLQSHNEAEDHPLGLPEDEANYSLWLLRREMLELRPDADAVRDLDWRRIAEAMRERFGYAPDPGTDPFLDLGRHFFPDILSREGHNPVTAAQRRFTTALPAAQTNEAMWNNPHDGPFRYDATAQQLYTQLPLRDAAVIHKLNNIRQLNIQEQAAVQELYFQPRLALAPFSFLFGDLNEAEYRMIQEPEECERWEYFKTRFALAYERAGLIARHLAEHVEGGDGHRHDEDGRRRDRDDRRQDEDDRRQDRDGRRHGDDAKHLVAGAGVILRHLWADENRSLTPWENDNGQTPLTTWKPMPTGGSYAALLALTGTGLSGVYEGQDTQIRWQEIRCHTKAFGHSDDESQCQIPTVLPALDLKFTPAQGQFAMVRNGLARADRRNLALGGAEAYRARWQGVLIIDREGDYSFLAGAPTPEGEAPDFRKIEEFHDWEVKLEQGQKKWILLSHGNGNGAPSHASGPICLKKGAYEISLTLERKKFRFDGWEEDCPQSGGFELKYQGPDSEGVKKVIPVEKLFIEEKDDSLATGVVFPKNPEGMPLGGAAAAYLSTLYFSSLRDIRRTYQRAYKALLFVHRFGLSGSSGHHHPSSEIGYFLAHPDLFAGESFYRSGGAFVLHKAGFDLNFLPVGDNYHSPAAAQDDRAHPSLQRSQALFDWWERIFDYTVMRRQARHSPDHPLWMLFYEALDQSPDIAEILVRYLGVDTRNDNLVLQYFDPGAINQLFQLDLAQLEDDRWPVRILHAEHWIQHVHRNFYDKDITKALPYTWAADDPDQPTAAGMDPGNKNLTEYYDEGCIHNGDPRRWKEIKALNDDLRRRGRQALLAYLTHNNRVPLPWGGSAVCPKDLSELLLLDVETGLCERASRIDEAITAVQLFVIRARLGLEPGFAPGGVFIRLWDERFADFRRWEACTRKTIYKENWVECEVLEKEQHSTAFQFLANELRSANLTVAAPGGMTWWDAVQLPAHPGIPLLQDRVASTVQIANPAFEEAVDLLGTPDYHGRPAWLAPFVQAPTNTGGTPTIPNTPGTNTPPTVPNTPGTRTNPNTPAATGAGGVRAASSAASGAAGGPAGGAANGASAGGTGDVVTEDLPLWFQAAIRLGTQFVRVAAACIPPASTNFKPKCNADGDGACCCVCGKEHPALIDEYYFWIEPSQYYEEVIQNADQGSAQNDPTTDWDRPDKLPGLLLWPANPMVKLRWCRVHNGRFMQPNQSFEGVAIGDPNGTPPAPQPGLTFLGRIGDSLEFSITTGIAPDGYPATPLPGFRYDLATDEAVVLPAFVATPAPAPIGGLPAFPFFGWFDPGAPVEPLTLFGTSVLVAGHLRAHCHYEAALKWYDLLYDPIQMDNRWHVCGENKDNPPGGTPGNNSPGGTPGNNGGNNPPVNTIPGNSGNNPPATTVPGNDGNNPPGATVPGNNGNCCCASDPVPHWQVKDRAILLLWLETMLQWGDCLMRERRPETFQQARQIFDTMAKIAGPSPLIIPAKTDDSKAPTVTAFVPACAPVNPRLMCLYMKIYDRLQEIHHCMDARRFRNGRPHMDMLYFGDSEVRDCWKTAYDNCCADEECCLPENFYRFLSVLPRAQEAAASLKSLGASLLAAYEKGDAEYLTALRTEQERQMTNLALEVNQYQWRAADWQVQSLQKAKEVAQTSLQYYNGLIAVGLTPGESQYEPLTVTSTTLRTAGNISVAIGQAFNIVPDPYVGFPSNFVKLPIGTKTAMIFNSAGAIANAAADIVNTIASLGLTKDGWARRLAEWKYQVSVITVQIEQITRQILEAERQRDAALRLLNNQQQQIDNLEELHRFSRDKFTDDALYLWLQQETSALYYQTYELTLQYARQAQRAFNFERGHMAREFLPRQAWNNLHEGLMCGEKLDLALRTMEKAYYDENRREYEITKHISLRLLFPKAFLQLRMTGYCEIDLAEWMFDQDYPGQYMRRIKNVTMTLPCVAGPYTGVHCRLTLLSSGTRIKPELIRAPHLCCDAHRCDNGYEPIPDDPRIVRQYAATEAIATSGGANESGTFEVNFLDDRYLPFEFMGAVSRWRIELPCENNYFDLETLSDVVLHLNYTSREGGEMLRAAASECARWHLPGEGVRFFDVRRELPDAWQMFTMPVGHQRRLPAGEEWGREERRLAVIHEGFREEGHHDKDRYPDRYHGEDKDRWHDKDRGYDKDYRHDRDRGYENDHPRQKLGLRLSRNMFPFLPCGREIQVCAVEILFKAPCATPSVHHTLEFLVGKRHEEIPEGRCDCEVRPVVCIAEKHWPHLFHGVLELEPVELEGRRFIDLGVLRFPHFLEDVGEIYLFCHYHEIEEKHCTCQQH